MCAARASASGLGRWRALTAWLRAGALYDLVFALLMVAAPAVLERAFGLPLPGEAFYLRLIAVLLTLLAATYWFIATDPESFRPLIWVAVAGRTLGFLVLGISAIGRPDLAGLWAAALGDLAFAVVTFAAGRRLLLP